MKTFDKGTAVEITTKLDDSSPTSVKISIADPDATAKVTAAAMTASSDGYEYTYYWQSAVGDEVGTYTITIDVVKGVYTSKSKSTFALE